MGASERRIEILKTLCRRRHETIENLAFEYGVSQRTILRDIEFLSLSEPIYTRCGRYGGGVYIDENYYMAKQYMSPEKINVLKKLAQAENNKSICVLSREEKNILNSIISEYSKPNISERK